MRINISIDDELLKVVDEYCRKYFYKRSQLIAELLREKIFSGENKNGEGGEDNDANIK